MFVLACVLVTPTAYAFAPSVDFIPLTSIGLVPEVTDNYLTELEVNALITKYAIKHDVNWDEMKAVVVGENQPDKNGIYDITKQSNYYFKDGTREESYGLVMINLPWNPNITYEQAINPDFAINFLAEKLSQGKGRLWTVYRNKFM